MTDSEIKTRDFLVNQIITTKKIISKFSKNKEFSPTMLLNSLLSLVVLLYEKAKKHDKSRVFVGKMADLYQSFGFTPILITAVLKKAIVDHNSRRYAE